MTSNDRKRSPWPVLVFIACVGLPSIVRAAAARNPWEFSLRGEAELRYDDNILSLSEREKDLLNEPAIRDSDRFKIKSVEDVIFVPDLGLNFSRSPRKGLETNIRLTLRAYDYLRNSVKDYQEYALSVRQELNRSRAHRTVIRLGGSHIPYYYLRQLIDDDESTAAGKFIRNSADYELNRGYVEVYQELVNRILSLTGSYARERRNYNMHFDERDSSSNVISLEMSIYPLRRLAWLIHPYIEHEDRTSRGDIGVSPVVDDDVSFESDLVGISMRWLWGRDRDHRHVINAFFEHEKRDFTTEFSPDISHFDREDDIKKYGAGYDREFGPRWRMRFSAYHRSNDVTLPTRGQTTFEKSVFSASMVYGFERDFNRRSRKSSR